MKIDLSEIIGKLIRLQKKFNETTDPTERYSIICAINHIAEHELPLKSHILETHYQGMMRNNGIKI